MTTKKLTLRSVNIFYNAHASVILRLVLERQDIRIFSTKRIRIINVILFPILILKVLSCSNETHILAPYYRIPYKFIHSALHTMSHRNSCNFFLWIYLTHLLHTICKDIWIKVSRKVLWQNTFYLKSRRSKIRVNFFCGHPVLFNTSRQLQNYQHTNIQPNICTISTFDKNVIKMDEIPYDDMKTTVELPWR